VKVFSSKIFNLFFIVCCKKCRNGAIVFVQSDRRSCHCLAVWWAQWGN